MTGQPQPFEYAILRIVPRVDRGEAINAGILLYCRPLGYLRALVELDRDRLLALDPARTSPAIERALAAIVEVCEQDPAAGQARPAGHRPPVRLADGAAQHGGAARPGSYRTD